jgi:dTDP-4-dehydrorhamnose reductase
MENNKIIGTGLTGLVGSRVVELLKDSYNFQNISTSTGVDITNASQVEDAIRSSDASVVIHFAAKTDVDGCEADKAAGEVGDAWRINVEGTRNVANAASKAGKKLIYISTEFVFDGKKEFYTEKDTPNPVNWYAKTKYEGEKIVQALTTPWIIARPAYPYRTAFEKKDFVRAIIGRLQKGGKIMGVTDHIFTPTFIDDIAYALDALFKNETSGIYHLVGSSSLSPYDSSKKIAEVFNLDQSLIEPTTRAEFFARRAERPFALRIKNDRITELGVQMKSFDQGLEVLKNQL